MVTKKGCLVFISVMLYQETMRCLQHVHVLSHLLAVGMKLIRLQANLVSSIIRAEDPLGCLDGLKRKTVTNRFP